MPTTDVIPRPNRIRPVSAWELPSLLVPLYSRRRTSKKRSKERKHYPAILAFVYRNRFVVGSQVQQRFSHVLRSDRTTRRHLEELEGLGLLDVVPTRGLGAHFPKVFFATARGVRKLKESLKHSGTAWEPGRVDRPGRRRREGYSADTVLHELLTTQFMLDVWRIVQGRPDLELLAVQRRSLAKHASFHVTVGHRRSRLIPDSMFVYRQAERGMMACFVELDNGTMNKKQLVAKFRRYDAWARSVAGQQYLIDLYRRHGATNPQPVFRILLIARDRANTDDERRLAALMGVMKLAPSPVRDRLWLTTAAALATCQSHGTPLAGQLWLRARDREQSSIAESQPAPRHSLFPA